MYVWTKGHLVVELDSQVGIGRDNLKGGASHLVGVGTFDGLGEGYAHDETFVNIEFHLPELGPFLKAAEVFLEKEGVFMVVDFPVDETVVSKKAHIGFDIVRNVINEY